MSTLTEGSLRRLRPICPLKILHLTALPDLTQLKDSERPRECVEICPLPVSDTFSPRSLPGCVSSLCPKCHLVSMRVIVKHEVYSLIFFSEDLFPITLGVRIRCPLDIPGTLNPCTFPFHGTRRSSEQLSNRSRTNQSGLDPGNFDNP